MDDEKSVTEKLAAVLQEHVLRKHVLLRPTPEIVVSPRGSSTPTKFSVAGLCGTKHPEPQILKTPWLSSNTHKEKPKTTQTPNPYPYCLNS